MPITEPCPICEAPVEVSDDLELSEVIVCLACDAEIEIVGVDPITFAPFEEEEK